MEKSIAINIKQHRGFFLAAVLLFWFSQYTFVPVFTPYLTETLLIPSAVAGSIVGAYGLVQMFVRLPVGVFGSRGMISRVIMSMGCIVLLLAAGVMLRFQSAGMLWFSRALAGLSAASWVCFSVSYGDNFSEGDPHAIAAVLLANNSGQLLAYLSAMLLQDRLGIDSLFILSGVADVAALVMMLLSFRGMPPKAGEKGISLASFKKILCSKKLWGCSFLVSVMQVVGFATIFSFTANYASSIGCSGTEISALSLVNMLSGVAISTTINKGWLDRFKQERVLALSFMIMFGYCLLVPRCGSFWPLLVLQLVCGLGRSAIMTTMMEEALIEADKSQRTTAMGIFQSVYGIGMTVGPVLMGRVLELVPGFSEAYGVISVVCLVGTALSLILKSVRHEA